MKTAPLIPLSLTLCLLTGTKLALQAAETAQAIPGAIDARMLRYPDVSATQIAFVYAGDIWVAPKSGGTASRLSSPKGEETFPRFSPDGARIAFTGNYDGNQDIYVINAGGGLPHRLTFHGAPDRMIGWYPDGKQILFASMRTSQKDRFNQLYRMSIEGGLPEQLPVPYGEFGAISPDSKTLAYTPITVDFRTWKRYRGGMNPDIWFFDLEKHTARNVTHNDANDSIPMWHGSTLYFLSDRDDNKRANIWACDTKNDKFHAVTTFKEYDTHFPSIGPEDIVFENGGRLYLLDLATEKTHPVEIKIVTDRATLKPQAENVSGYIHSADVSPSGKRAVFEARGELFTVPAENGFIRNLTQSPGVAERFPAWSPDGNLIAYFSDRSGEYELTVRNADGSGAETNLTKLGPGFRYTPFWSPDSKKIAFIDQAMKIWIHDLDRKETREIDKLLWQYHGGLNPFQFFWSPDSRWVAYPGDLENRNTAIVLFDTKESARHQVTTGYYSDDKPVFSPDGKYLFFRTGRTFSPTYSDLDTSWIYANSQVLAAVPLRKDVPSPLAPRDDEENEKKSEKKDADKKVEEKKSDSGDAAKKESEKKSDAKDSAPSKDGEKKDEKKVEKPKPVEIDLEGFERRVVILPPKPGRYDDLSAVAGKLIFRRLPRTGSADEKSPIVYYDLEKREEKTVLEDSDGYSLSAKGEKMLASKSGSFAIIEVKEGQKLDKKLATASLEATIDPVAEWRQIFNDTWRMERDYFYDPGMHGVDWNAMKYRYEALLNDCVTRWDVNYVIGELISELNASHTYRSGGDVENPASRGVGYLGCDFSLENGGYRIKKIIEAGEWDSEVRSPLRQSGVDIKEGDYLLAVNGVPLEITQEPWAAFQGLADKPVMLTVNSKPDRAGAREVLVQTITNEARLRNLAWIEEKRKRVEEATDGKVAYVYVPDTGINGQNELVRQWRGQVDKQAMIIDERFNSGGQIPDRFIEMLNRPVQNYWGVRDGHDWAWPPIAQDGPKVMLMNGWSGSGGDCFPFYFKKAGLGPLIGERTWGGLIGITGAPTLVDNGNITVPTFGIYSTKGEWIIEGHGVDPDIPVVDDPAAWAKGQDPQLERAIVEIQKLLKKNPPALVKKPKYPKKPA
jgi:tricorn protease